METITVRYDEFVKGVESIAKLQALKDILENGAAFASDSVLAILNIPKEKTASDTDRE